MAEPKRNLLRTKIASKITANEAPNKNNKYAIIENFNRPSWMIFIGVSIL